MPITRFPDPRSATEEGIVAVGGDLDPESLILAYQKGIFPWPIEGLPLPWFCPDPRAILEFKDLHIPKSLEKVRRKTPFRISMNEAFVSIIEACSMSPRPGQPGTWINPEMVRAYRRLNELGFAHSVEVWEGKKIVGGLYGVGVDGNFSGESMFHKKPNASKLAFLFLVDQLKEKGVQWIDIQVMTPHMKLFGAVEISRDSFLRKLAQSCRPGMKLF